MKNFLFSVLAITSIITTIAAQTTADFENITVPANTYIKDAGPAKGFESGNIFLPNEYVDEVTYDYWSGFSISNRVDTTSAGFTNEASTFAGQGYDGSSNFAVAYVFGSVNVKLMGSAAGELVKGFYVSNNTYAALSMRNGDSVSKKFGGETGDDPDFFKMTIQKFYNGLLGQEMVEFYLADFRFPDNSQDYIIKEWTWVDLNGLGKVDSLLITLSSSDNGQFGMNTPAYFCMDQFTTSDGVTSTFDLGISNEVYPNPTDGIIRVDGQYEKVLIYDSASRLVTSISDGRRTIVMNHLDKGIYYLKFDTGEVRKVVKI